MASYNKINKRFLLQLLLGLVNFGPKLTGLNTTSDLIAFLSKKPQLIDYDHTYQNTIRQQIILQEGPE